MVYLYSFSAVIMVVYEEIDADTVYPVTAYDVPRRQGP